MLYEIDNESQNMTEKEKLKISKTWNLEKITKNLTRAFDENSEINLLAILRENSFLFYELYNRKYGIQPTFHEISFSGTLRCDFAWLNDNSDGPEWVLVEVEKPRMKLFTKKNEPSQSLNHAIEQVKSWRRFFNENPSDKKRIFGAVSKFRFIIIGGEKTEWQKEKPAKWRIDNNAHTEFEIRSSDVFLRPLKILKEKPEELWSFAEFPTTLKHSQLESYWMNYDYMDSWRKVLS